MKPNVIIRGIVEDSDESNKQIKEKAKNFFKEQMEIEEDIEVKNAYCLGISDKDDRPMLVKLANSNDKAKIFKSVSKLKGKENIKRRAVQHRQ